MKIAVDAMGGDYAPEQVVFGAVRAARKYGCEIVLVGDEPQIREVLKREDGWEKLGITIHHTTQVIEMDEHPADAVRTKKDASVVVATRLVKEGKCDAVLSAGSTGAAVTAAQLILRRIKGIGRPTIATPMPTPKGVTLLLDSGANVDSKPEHLVQSGIMGSIYAEYVFGREKPRVGLLNVGRERGKGTALLREAHGLLAESGLNFVGNVEGGDLYADLCDVIVCDGLSGNLLLKGTEAAGLDAMRLALEAAEALPEDRRGPMLALAERIRLQFDFNDQGGAVFLGPVKPVIKMHGCARADTVVACVDQLARLVGGQ